MVLIDLSYEDDLNLHYADVNFKVKKKMREMLKEAANQNHSVNWERFKHYCIEWFDLPECTIERAISEIKHENEQRLRKFEEDAAREEKEVIN